jgi:hypothetical protein
MKRSDRTRPAPESQVQSPPPNKLRHLLESKQRARLKHIGRAEFSQDHIPTTTILIGRMPDGLNDPTTNPASCARGETFDCDRITGSAVFERRISARPSRASLPSHGSNRVGCMSGKPHGHHRMLICFLSFASFKHPELLLFSANSIVDSCSLDFGMGITVGGCGTRSGLLKISTTIAECLSVTSRVSLPRGNRHSSKSNGAATNILTPQQSIPTRRRPDTSSSAAGWSASKTRHSRPLRSRDEG